MHEIWAYVWRRVVLGSVFFLPRSRRIAIERRLRGKEEYRKLRHADWVLVSWGKSGRTWFRVMVSRFYQIKHGLPVSRLLEFDNLHRMNAVVPKVFFTHNNYLRDYLNVTDDLSHFTGKKVVLLVRDPRDVAVSQFFQWKYRMLPGKKLLNRYPQHGSDTDVWSFITHPDCGIPRIVDFLNDWASAVPELGDNLLVIRYEDMRKDPHAVMRRVLDFVATPGTPEEIDKAVEFAAYENMKKLEEKKQFKGSGARVRPGDKSNPNSFKVRRAKVGGYRDYFEDDKVAVIDGMVQQRLAPLYGYKAAGEDAQAQADQQAS